MPARTRTTPMERWARTTTPYASCASRTSSARKWATTWARLRSSRFTTTPLSLQRNISSSGRPHRRWRERASIARITRSLTGGRRTVAFLLVCHRHSQVGNPRISLQANPQANHRISLPANPPGYQVRSLHASQLQALRVNRRVHQVRSQVCNLPVGPARSPARNHRRNLLYSPRVTPVHSHHPGLR